MLTQPTLVLNKNWTAIGTVACRQAIVLVCRASAAVVCPESYEIFELEAWLRRSLERCPQLEPACYVRTSSYPVEKPEVIRLSRYGGIPRREVAFSRRNLYRRDAHRCQYCGKRSPPAELSIDHVLPRSRGGRTSWENCVLACVRCNTKKADRTPQESGLRLRRRPVRPTWSPLLESLPQSRPTSWRAFVKDAG